VLNRSGHRVEPPEERSLFEKTLMAIRDIMGDLEEIAMRACPRSRRVMEGKRTTTTFEIRDS
jgi:hypothetical protein